MVMSFAHGFPQWLIVLIVIFLGLVLWILIRSYESRDHSIQIERSGDLLVSFLVIISFAFGIFSAYLLLIILPYAK